MTDTRSRGSWMQTHTNRAFYPMDPTPGDIDIVDIAHALGNLCRYNGHVNTFYSVAEHCVHVAAAQDNPRDALWGLLHDATEAYVGDMIRPLKQHMPDYVEAEAWVMKAIVDKFNLDSHEMPASVKDADDRMLLNERAVLKGTPPQEWDVPLEPLPGVLIRAWNPIQATNAYLNMFRLLTGETIDYVRTA